MTAILSRPQYVNIWFIFLSLWIQAMSTTILSKSVRVNEFIMRIPIPGKTVYILRQVPIYMYAVYPNVYIHIVVFCRALRWRHNELDSFSNHQPHDCLLNHLFRRWSKKTSKLRVTGLCAGNSPGTGDFPAQMACGAENVSIWWRHHGGGKVMYVFSTSQIIYTYIALFVGGGWIVCVFSIPKYVHMALFCRDGWVVGGSCMYSVYPKVYTHDLVFVGGGVRFVFTISQRIPMALLCRGGGHTSKNNPEGFHQNEMTPIRTKNTKARNSYRIPVMYCIISMDIYRTVPL